MSYLTKGSFSEEEVKEVIGKDVMTAYAKYKDNPNQNYYPFWDSIKNPENGETLEAVKGYVNPNDARQCYYAEYKDSKNNYYYYFDSRAFSNPEFRGDLSIDDQMSKDNEELKNNIEQKHSKFFTDENNNSESNTQGNVNAESNVNKTTQFNGNGQV